MWRSRRAASLAHMVYMGKARRSVRNSQTAGIGKEEPDSRRRYYNDSWRTCQVISYPRRSTQVSLFISQPGHHITALLDSVCRSWPQDTVESGQIPLGGFLGQPRVERLSVSIQDRKGLLGHVRSPPLVVRASSRPPWVARCHGVRWCLVQLPCE
jgi:hypothetical protein